MLGSKRRGRGLQMSSSEIAIKVDGLSKRYEVYDSPGDRLKQFFVPRICRLLGLKSSQYFREFWALKDISFEVKRGETVAIIGRNGSGKSTLLQMICGTLNPTTGSIGTNGRVAALLELGSGFNPEFTGRENVYLNASVLGLSNREIDDRLEDILKFADIGQFIDQPTKTYSSGMIVRLAFAVIAHVEPDILVIDEALAVGDAFFTQKCMRFLRNFMKSGTVIFVSHDTSAVIGLCSRAIWLSNGKKIQDDESKIVCQSYLQELYESNQGTSGVKKVNNLLPEIGVKQRSNSRDFRLENINNSQYKNIVEVFEFKYDSGAFGTGLGRIEGVEILSREGEALPSVVGGEDVIVRITCSSSIELDSPIVGFLINDRLGQPLFGDNTCRFLLEKPKKINPGKTFTAEFSFNMPILPKGEYSVTVALANGTQLEHIQHHWIHDALILKSHSSSVCTGLIGVPMKEIRIQEND